MVVQAVAEPPSLTGDGDSSRLEQQRDEARTNLICMLSVWSVRVGRMTFYDTDGRAVAR